MIAGPEWVRAARVVKPHGVDGEVCLEMLGGGPRRLTPGSEVRSPRGVLQIDGIREAGNFVLGRLSGISDRDAAATLCGGYLEVAADQLRPLPEGEYFHFQLIGLEVQDESGHVQGELIEVESYPANDVYVVRTGRGELRIPAVRHAVTGIDLAGRVMTVASAFLEDPVDAL
ncbi:MAG: ribosome maturation factor RimM [Candidatus Dormibacteria bacterium]